MPRPTKSRQIQGLPSAALYIPAGWTRDQRPVAEIAIEDFEVMRLVDGHAYGLKAAADSVGVSKSTAGRMLQRARRALALGFERRVPLLFEAAEKTRLISVAKPGVDRAATNPDNGGARFAVAADGKDIDGAVAGIFGRAACFAIFEGGSECPAWIENEGARAARWSARKVVGTLSDHGVRVVAAGRFGPEAIKGLAGAGIKPVPASGLRIREAFGMLLS